VDQLNFLAILQSDGVWLLKPIKAPTQLERQVLALDLHVHSREGAAIVYVSSDNLPTKKLSKIQMKRLINVTKDEIARSAGAQ